MCEGVCEQRGAGRKCEGVWELRLSYLPWLSTGELCRLLQLPEVSQGLETDRHLTPGLAQAAASCPKPGMSPLEPGSAQAAASCPEPLISHAVPGSAQATASCSTALINAAVMTAPPTLPLVSQSAGASSGAGTLAVMVEHLDRCVGGRIAGV